MLILKICENYDEASLEASKIIIDAIKSNPCITLGLATGSSPLGIYKNLINAYKEHQISFKDITTYNLDEYVGIDRSHKQSYYFFIHENLLNHVDINENNVHIPYADLSYAEECCRKYNDMLNNSTIDIQILGIGSNGHIAFNEPGTSFQQETFIIKLTEQTRNDNKRFFTLLEEVPTHAITMGIKNILNAKKIILIATGENKAPAIKRLMSGEITEEFPASVLNNHSDVTIFVDKAAASLL